jgi:phospholipid/cholesterol/gamma-HCH transport system substrate-binding protein
MENKAHALAAGIFVVALAALAMILAGWLTRERGLRDTYEISTRETVTGLQPQAPVKLRGVDVGKVSKIGFDAKVPGNVLLRLEVDEDVKLTKDTFATLSYQGITGLAFIQLSDHGKPAARLVPNDDAPPRIPLEPGLMSKLESKGEVILEQVEQVTTRMNRLLNDENQKRFSSALASLDGAAGSAKQLAERLDSSVQKQLDPTLAQARTTLKAVDEAADEVGRTATEFGKTARRLAEKDGPIDKLGQGTDALAGAAERFSITTLPRLNRTAEEASRTLRTVRRTVNDIGDNPQQLIYGEGKLEPGPGEPGFKAPGGPR